MPSGISRVLQRCLVGVVCLTAVVACAAPIKPGSPKRVAGNTQFTFSAPKAKMVSVVGSFNGWGKRVTPMKQAGSNGVWVAEVPLKSGEHTFMFLVDDNDWVAPPLADDFVTDGFGQTNGVVVVR
jgi:1,4-alpha-glucan branching enzyme